MKTKNLLLMGVSMMILAGCGGEAEETDEVTEEGMGTLSAESEEENETDESMEESSEDSDLNDEDTEPTKSDSGLLDISDTRAGWINFEGTLGGSSDYRTTEPVDYDSSQDYELTVGAYIAYYNGDEYIQTVQESEGVIEQVENADNIRVSFHKSFSNRISLNEQ